MVNSQIRQFRTSLIALVNASGLPIEIKRLVFSEIHNEINIEAEKAIQSEKENKEKEEEENNDKTS